MGKATSKRHLVGISIYSESGGWIRNARLTVRAAAPSAKNPWGGRKIGPATQATTGSAILSLRRVPQRFTVVATGGRVNGERLKGHLLATVNRHRSGEFVQVNPASTVVTHFAHRTGIRGVRAEERVRRTLGVRRNYDLRSDVFFTPARSLNFSGERMLRKAAKAGGMDTYAARLAQRASRGRKGTVDLGPRKSVAASVEQSRISASAGDKPSWFPDGAPGALFDGLSTLLKTGEEKASSAALSWIGQEIPFLSFLADGTEAELDKINDKLDQISEQVAELQQSVKALQTSVNRLEALVTAAEFSTLASEADQLTNAVDTLQAALAGIGNTAKAAKSDADAKQVALVWKQFLKNIGAMLVNVPGEGLTSSLMGKYLKPPVGKGLLYWANQMSIFKDENDDNELYSTATSQLPLGAMLYYAGYEVQAAQFEALYYRSPTKYNGGGLPDTASCPAGSPTTASPACQTLGAAAQDLATYPDLIVPVLPDNTLLDLENNQMWITDIDGSQANYDPVVPAGGCPGNADMCQNLFDRDAGMDLGHGSLSPIVENAYGALGANLTRGWIVRQSPIAGSENGQGKPADGGAPAFHIATSTDLANLIPKNPTAPTGTQSQTQPVSVRDWLHEVAGVEYDQTAAPDLWVGDATAPTYPVPVVNVTGWTPDPWNFQAPLCAYGGTNGMKNWASYLMVSLTGENGPNPGDCPNVGWRQPVGSPNMLPNDNDAPPEWQTNSPGVVVGPSDISQAPWSGDYDDTVLRADFVTPEDALWCRTSGTLATSSGGTDQGGTPWQIAGLTVDDGEGGWFSGFPDSPAFVTGPFNWSAADSDGLHFKGQVIDLTSKSFPQTQFSPEVRCGTSHGTMMLVRDAKANFYMNPSKN